LLEHIQGHADVWLCSRERIARHWIEQHPPQR
jgi:allantoinase